MVYTNTKYAFSRALTEFHNMYIRVNDAFGWRFKSASPLQEIRGFSSTDFDLNVFIDFLNLRITKLCFWEYVIALFVSTRGVYKYFICIHLSFTSHIFCTLRHFIELLILFIEIKNCLSWWQPSIRQNAGLNPVCRLQRLTFWLLSNFVTIATYVCNHHRCDPSILSSAACNLPPMRSTQFDKDNIISFIWAVYSSFDIREIVPTYGMQRLFTNICLQSFATSDKMFLVCVSNSNPGP